MLILHGRRSKGRYQVQTRNGMRVHFNNLEKCLIKLFTLNMKKNYSFTQYASNNCSPSSEPNAQRVHNISMLNRTPQNFNKPDSNTNYQKYFFLDPKEDLRSLNNLKGREKSPKVRQFLRHTTYLPKRESIIDSQQQDFLKTSTGEHFMKKKYQQISGKYCSRPSDKCASHPEQGNLKFYGNQTYDEIAYKVQNTASELKKMKEASLRRSQPNKSDFLTFETEKFEAKDNTSWASTSGFKKKLYQDFYTPKPEPTANLEKIKRGYTPNIKTISSPLHKKPQEKIKIEQFILEERLGGGKFGTVFKAIHIKTRSIYALKKIPKKMLKDNMMIDQFILEVKIQTFMKHENILEIFGVFDDDEHVYMILQFMEQGTLYSALKKKKKLSEKQASIKIKQVAKAIVYMHENGIVHRDIKPENIVMSGGVCKLCDFGWATVCEDRRKTYCGTFDYAAPQILQGLEYDMSVDLWCLGVLAYELMVGKAPFYHISRKQTISNILNVEQKKITFPANISEKARSFVESLLRKQSEKRLSYQQILNHPFLRNVDENE